MTVDQQKSYLYEKIVSERKKTFHDYFIQHVALQNHVTISKHLANPCQKHQFSPLSDVPHTYKRKMSSPPQSYKSSQNDVKETLQKSYLSVAEMFSVSTGELVQPAALSPTHW